MKIRTRRNSKQLVITIATLVATVLIASPAFALPRVGRPVTGEPRTKPSTNTTTDTNTDASNNSSSTTSTKSAQAQAAKLKVLQARANAEIERRIKVLDGLTTLVTNSKKLNSADKASLNAEISGEITGDSTFTGLNNLKAKIDADASLSVALQDTKSIVTEYRVFLFIVPQVRIVSTADQQQTIEGKLTSFATKLQTRINEAQSQGKDVSTLQTEYNSMIQSISKAGNLSGTTEDVVIALRPADYDGNTTILKQYRQDLQTAHQDNKAALADAKQIVQGLEQL